MRTFVLDHLDGHAFSYTPADATKFEVFRANPGTVVRKAKNGAIVRESAPAAATVTASPLAPLTLFPGDRITIADSDEFLDHLVATGQAHEVSE